MGTETKQSKLTREYDAITYDACVPVYKNGKVQTVKTVRMPKGIAGSIVTRAFNLDVNLIDLNREIVDAKLAIFELHYKVREAFNFNTKLYGKWKTENADVLPNVNHMDNAAGNHIMDMVNNRVDWFKAFDAYHMDTKGNAIKGINVFWAWYDAKASTKSSLQKIKKQYVETSKALQDIEENKLTEIEESKVDKSMLVKPSINSITEPQGFSAPINTDENGDAIENDLTVFFASGKRVTRYVVDGEYSENDMLNLKIMAQDLLIAIRKETDNINEQAIAERALATM